MDLLTAIELIEDRDGTVANCYVMEAWQYLVDSGSIHHLQGWYGRTASDLMEAGLIKPPTQH